MQASEICVKLCKLSCVQRSKRIHSEQFQIFFRRFQSCVSKFNISARNNDNKTIQNSIFIRIYTEKSLHSSIGCVCSQARGAPSTARERDNTGPRGGCQLPAPSLQWPRFPVIASASALSHSGRVTFTASLTIITVSNCGDFSPCREEKYWSIHRTWNLPPSPSTRVRIQFVWLAGRKYHFRSRPPITNVVFSASLGKKSYTQHGDNEGDPRLLAFDLGGNLNVIWTCKLFTFR